MARKADIKQIEDVAAQHGLTGPWRRRYGEAVEDAKVNAEYPVVNGKLSWEHLNEIATQFKVDHGIS